MNRKSAFFFIAICLIAISHIYGQNNVSTFYSTIRNHGWIVNSYLVSSGQKEKKSLFKDYTLRFKNADSSVFNIEANGINNRVGYCRINKYGRISFSFPLIPDDNQNYTATDSLYNEVAKQLSTGLFQIYDLKSSKIKFRLLDPFQGEVFLELLKKD